MAEHLQESGRVCPLGELEEDCCGDFTDCARGLRPHEAQGSSSGSADRPPSGVYRLPDKCRCQGDGATWADTSACPIHDTETSHLAQAVVSSYEHGRIASLELAAKRYADALDYMLGGIDREPWVTVYRAAGGGYEGLQAVAREALGRD